MVDVAENDVFDRYKTKMWSLTGVLYMCNRFDMIRCGNSIDDMFKLLSKYVLR